MTSFGAALKLPCTSPPPSSSLDHSTMMGKLQVFVHFTVSIWPAARSTERSNAHCLGLLGSPAMTEVDMTNCDTAIARSINLLIGLPRPQHDNAPPES